MGVCAIYPGTFDPITAGHIDLVERSCRMFDEVIIAVAKSTPKNTCFTTEERIALAADVFAEQSNLRVVEFQGLLVKFCQDIGANVVVRGLRGVTDFDYEMQLAGMNRKMAPEVETIFLTPAPDYAHISSTLVRQIAQLGGDVDQFVHPLVRDALAEKFRK